MPRKGSLEQELADLAALRSAPTSERSIENLRRALGGKNSHLVAAAARIAGEFEIDCLEPDLVRAFERFMVEPAGRDKGCTARWAIAEALCRIGYAGEDIFLRGVRHVQLEPAHGGREDTAARLRGACGLGLVRVHSARAMFELARLLADPKLDARLAAVRAILYSGQEAGVPLLTFKVLSGDAEAQVLYECFGALLSLDPGVSLPLVAGFLDHEDGAIAESAALALGESRLEQAFDSLRKRLATAPAPGLRRILLLAIALLRTEKALDLVLSLVAEAPPATARDAVAALETYRADENLWGRVQKLVDERGDVPC